MPFSRRRKLPQAIKANGIKTTKCMLITGVATNSQGERERKEAKPSTYAIEYCIGYIFATSIIKFLIYDFKTPHNADFSFFISVIILISYGIIFFDQL